MERIAFIGVGIMGKSMVRNLMRAGFELHIFARHPEKVSDVVSEGAIPHASIGECVKSCGTVITMVGFPQDVEEVYWGDGNILDSAAPGTTLIDMTTTSPSLAERLFAEAKQRSLRALDAPVTGGDTGARNGTLSILVGGEREDFERCMPVFRAMGNNINYQGAAGCGQHAKIANQIIIAGTIAGICEAVTYAKAKGLDGKTFLASVSTGAAGSSQLNALGTKILEGDYAPGFFVKHFIKDMKIADDEAKKDGMELNILAQVLKQYQQLETEGHGDDGTQSLIEFYKHKKTNK